MKINKYLYLGYSVGEKKKHPCDACESMHDTVYEEYILEGDESALGIRCKNCGHEEDPEEFSLRFEPEYNPICGD